MNKSISKQIIAVAISGVLILASLAGCTQNNNTQTTASTGTESSSGTQTSDTTATTTTDTTSLITVSQTADVGNSDLNTEWDSQATMISLEGTSISVNGSGATASGAILTITTAGTYVVSGTLTDGQIVINATKDEKVHLILNGVDITNTSGAPIYAPQCDKLIVTLADGTQNTLTDGGSNYQYADTANEEPNAALFCKDDLTINGTGSLTVNAGFNNGIGTKDDLLIVSGNITVNAANHGLRGNDSVTILDGNIQITAANDGIQTNNTEDTSLGYILIESGTLTITAGHDGIQADTALSITGGTLNITTDNQSTATDSTSDSYKGLKATSDIVITGGSFTIDSADDSIHTNGNVSISGGEFTLSSGDDGIHADTTLTINGGTIIVEKSYEGLEAANIIIADGTIDITSSDDAINAAGGVDQSGSGQGFGGDKFAASGAYSINVSGGNISFVAGGDGIDSNGSVDISGGNIIALISSSADNGAVDCDGTVTFTGGTIIYGGTGIGSVPGQNSTQSYAYTDKGISAGTEVSLQSGGQTLASFTPAINCQYLAISTPDIVSGQSYDFYSGSTLAATVSAGTGGGGMMGGGGKGDMGGGGGRR